VRLVCFDGDGREGVQLADAELSRHLDAMSVGERVPLTAYTPARTLHVSRRLLFHVSHTRPQLCARVTEALRKAQGEGSVAVVTVDVVLAADHAASAEAYTLYVLNPALLTLGEEERLYAYTEDQNAEHGCEFPAWVSRERYAWLDLSAGPISMGPSISGSGAVFEESLPRVLSRHAGVGRATERARSELAMEIAATVASGAAHLLAPPLERLPPCARPRTVVRIFELFVDGGGGARATLELASAGAGVDYDGLVGELRAASLPTEKLSVESVTVPAGGCPACEAAYAYALDARSSSTVTDGVTVVRTSPFLNSKTMLHWLAKLGPEISRQALASGAVAKAHAGKGSRKTDEAGFKNSELKEPLFGAANAAAVEAEVNLVVGFVVTVAHPRLLLFDSAHQSAASDGLAVAIRQPDLPPAQGDHQCAGRSLSVSSPDCTRPLLGALLRAAWGVGPSHVQFDAQTSTPKPNYLWATGLTPFGPFSTSRKLSFSYLDAARNARLYALLEPALQQVHVLLGTFVPFGRQLDDVLSPREHRAFVRRWNFFLHKLKRATTYMSLHNFEQAHYYALSLAHELVAMSSIVESARFNLVTSLHCSSPGSATSWSLAAMSAVGLSATMLIGTVLLVVLNAAGKRGPGKPKAY